MAKRRLQLRLNKTEEYPRPYFHPQKLTLSELTPQHVQDHYTLKSKEGLSVKKAYPPRCIFVILGAHCRRRSNDFSISAILSSITIYVIPQIDRSTLQLSMKSSSNKICNFWNLSSERSKTPSTGAVIVSDLTYVRVNHKWHYICILIDLYNRKIIGHSASSHQDVRLVYDAFASVHTNLDQIQMQPTNGVPAGSAMVAVGIKVTQSLAFIDRPCWKYPSACPPQSFQSLW